MSVRHVGRRGVVLALVIPVMVVAAGLLTLLATSGAQLYRDRQADRVRLVARAMADSAAVYARAHLDTWANAPLDEPVRLDVKHLLPPEMTGSATVTVLTIEGQTVCRVAAHVSRGAYAATDEIELK